MAKKTNKLTVGLVKASLHDFNDIVRPIAEPIEIEGVGTFYMERSRPRPPKWITDFFGAALGNNLQLINSSAKGALLIRVPDNENARVFVVLFGHGRHLLQDGVLEENFGLKVVLNSVDPNSLRSIDKIALGSVPKHSREQISREGGAANFGIDIEQDLVSSVTGKSRVIRFGRTISGRDTFAASAKFDVDDVHDFLAETFEFYQAETYKESFDWIDHIKDIRSTLAISALDTELIRRLQARELDHIWMAPYEVIDWADTKGFKFLRKRADLVSDLDIAELIRAAGERPIDIEWLKGSAILLLSARSDDAIARWSPYKCIYAEIEIDNTLHILNAGKWYRVASDFTQTINADFANIPNSTIELPEYQHENEAAYNVAATEALEGSHCLDGDLISHGGGQSKIEFCDILTADKKLIHVKRYSGSAQLSHLFSQGAVAAELFVSDAEFRRKLNEKLPNSHKLENFAVRPNPNDYEVVFTIISKSANPLNLPFFSKVAMRNARRRLEAYDFRVSKKKVRANGNEVIDAI